ncbi:AMP-binding protein [Nakamurella lactea]|uniref:AMP-binding protein n=1 Tax=Nakamurella lactea TaxID=459515 RepID=UPI000412A762|nr:AMP-binding protein [Nakamurella lactea]
MTPEQPRPASAPLIVAIAEQLERDPALSVTVDGRRWRLDELDSQARALAGSFAQRVVPGERIAVMARNGRLALLTWWAATYCGAYLVPLNVNNRGAIVTHQLTDSEPVLLVAESEFTEVLVEAVADLQPVLPFVIGGSDSVDAVPGYAGEVLDFDALVEAGDPVVPDLELDLSGTSHLVYTAGTTGPSKACQVSHGYVANMARQMRENLERTAADRLWTAMPLFHLSAIGHVVGSLQLGSEITIARRFSVSRFWDDVLAADATMVALMGSMLPMIARAPETESSRAAYGKLRAASGSPVTEDLARQWQERFGVQRVGSGAYGMTEACLLTMTPAGEYRAGSAGMLNDSFEVQIVDERDNPLPVGQIGEIVCRPKLPNIMFTGYWRQPEKSLEVFRGLWFHCGDFGRMDADGYLYFVDRGKDYLRRGGENISSYEIESIVAQHPQVREAAVHAVFSPLNEDEVKVTVVANDDSTLDPAELFEWIRPRVPRYAVPSHIEIRGELPKNAVGRVLKRELREQGVTAATWSTDPRAQEDRGAAVHNAVATSAGG